MTHRHLDSALRQAVILGTLAVLLIPAARGSSDWLGWLPLWLVGMPLAAWWSLRGSRCRRSPCACRGAGACRPRAGRAPCAARHRGGAPGLSFRHIGGHREPCASVRGFPLRPEPPMSQLSNACLIAGLALAGAASAQNRPPATIRMPGWRRSRARSRWTG
jgi:hypothetical protein